MRFLASLLFLICLVLFAVPSSAQFFGMPQQQQAINMNMMPQAQPMTAPPAGQKCLIIDACVDGVEVFTFDIGRLTHRHVSGIPIGTNPSCPPDVLPAAGTLNTQGGFYVSVEGDASIPRQWFASLTSHIDTRLPVPISTITPGQVNQMSGSGQTNVISNSMIQVVRAGSAPSAHKIRVCPPGPTSLFPTMAPLTPVGGPFFQSAPMPGFIQPQPVVFQRIPVPVPFQPRRRGFFNRLLTARNFDRAANFARGVQDGRRFGAAPLMPANPIRMPGSGLLAGGMRPTMMVEAEQNEAELDDALDQAGDNSEEQTQEVNEEENEEEQYEEVEEEQNEENEEEVELNEAETEMSEENEEEAEAEADLDSAVESASPRQLFRQRRRCHRKVQVNVDVQA